ncbi:MAG: methyl-accepting chemotaxis protein [Agathobaculum sp.]|uniref:methyl-accepting chemotaxis protein n=1 Tax=Agathobaculum sp. TaxID=2048138 RepID=UPI0025C33AD4|nr:methyl-accepting chemotaxis protein [Agathobaculum sp.]MCI7124785.1 methyl-accepting chemotaxis protein [Agathobaculum sp.]MDY3711644.1 methyl-accepting chemotaxis protein [Agathobaculum sp.]
MKLKNLRIAPRLILGYALPIVLSLILVIFALASTVSMRTRYEAVLNGTSEMENEVLTARMIINRLARHTRDIVLDTEMTNFASTQSILNTEMADLENTLDYIRTNYAKILPNSSAASNFLNSVDAWQAIAPQVVSAVTAGDVELASTILLTQCTPAIDTLASDAAKVSEELHVATQDAISSEARRVTSTIIIYVVMTVVFLLLTMIFAVRLISSIVSPLAETREAILQMSQGVLDHPVTYESKDEIGEVADAVRTSQDVLRSAISEISRISSGMAHGKFNLKVQGNFPGMLTEISGSLSTLLKQLGNTIAEIKQSANQVSSGAEQVSNGAQALAQGATEQASAVEELSATMNDISTSAHNNAESALTAREHADKAGKQNLASQEQMAQMITAMGEITSTSQEISKIIKTIEDIAFQTNILALNAAVEAARAGSAGKGFAVVADEVRNLASKSAEAAKNTTTLIEDSIRAVERGSSIAHAAAESITLSAELTSKAVDQIALIAEAAQNESESIDQVMQGIDQISTVVQTNSATSEESAAASEELSSQSNIMLQICNRFDIGNQTTSDMSSHSHAHGGGYYAGGSSPVSGETFRGEYEQASSFTDDYSKY